MALVGMKVDTVRAASMEVPFSVVSSYASTSTKFLSCGKNLMSMRFHVPFPSTRSLKFPLPSPSRTSKRNGFQLHSVAEGAILSEVEEYKKTDSRRKLYVLNLPWSLSVVDIKNLFGECGVVADVEIIKQKDGRSRGFAFVTMSSGEEAQAVIEKFDSYEVSGRIIRVQFSKRFKRPPLIPPPRPSEPMQHKLYVSNLSWKVRSRSLRELFSGHNPVSVRVVFESSSGRSAGYGFVSFATKEEAESAISVLDGKELLGRPIQLKFAERITDASETKVLSNEEQPENS